MALDGSRGSATFNESTSSGKPSRSMACTRWRHSTNSVMTCRKRRRFEDSFRRRQTDTPADDQRGGR
ncbi:hypothetical protein ACFPRL_17420 [Pseudoclavibacter helvolus]